MTVFILPTVSPIKYRGKYPNRARSIGGTTKLGRHVELNSGVRLWSCDDHNPRFCAGSLSDDYAADVSRAVPMTDEQYATLKEAMELLGTRKNYCGRGPREHVENAVRAMLLTIKADDRAFAKRNAENARQEVLSGHPRFAFDNDRPFRVRNRTPQFSGSFDFATLDEARAYLSDQLARRDSVVSGAAPVGPDSNSQDPLQSYIIWADGTETLGDMGWTPPAAGSDRWIAPANLVAVEAWPEGGSVEGAGTVASSWDELTGAEQNEARFRGFPREADTRYNVKRHYSDGEWMLTGWFKAGPGQPRTLTERMADYAAVDRSGLSPSDAVDSAIIRGDLDSWETPATVAPANMVAVGAVDGTFLALSAPAPVRLRQSRGPDGESRLEYANRIAAPVPSRNRTDNVEWHLGRNDYRAGITECPYADGGDRAARWAAGWQDAKEQAIRDNPESVEALKARIAALEEHIHALSDLLQGWPTIRALSASGARDASERKVKARATVAKMLDIMNREA